MQKDNGNLSVPHKANNSQSCQTSPELRVTSLNNTSLRKRTIGTQTEVKFLSTQTENLKY